MLKDTTIRQKLIFAFSMLVGLMLLIALISFYRLNQVNSKMEEITDITTHKVLLIGKIKHDITAISRDQKNLIASTELDQMNEISRGISKTITALTENTDKLEKISEGEMLGLVKELKNILEDYYNTNENIKQLSLLNTEMKAEAITDKEGKDALFKTLAILDAIASGNISKETSQKVYDLKEIIAEIYGFEKDMIIAKSEDDLNTHIGQEADALRRLDVVSAQLMKVLSGETKNQFDRFQNQFENFIALHNQVKDYSVNNSKMKAKEISKNVGEKIDDQADGIIDKINGIINTQLENDQVETESLYSSTIYTMTFVLIIAIGLGFGISNWLLKDVTGSISKAVNVIKKIAVGDFSADVRNDKKDEIGLMLNELQLMIDKLRSSVDVAKRVSNGDLTINFKNQKNHGGELDIALENMVDNLREIAISIYNGADNVASASQQVASASQNMSQSAQEQASSTEEVSSSMEQMVANIQQNTDNSRETEKIATKASKDIQTVSVAVNETVDAINLIASKIAIIEEIASKTDLLALNAAVEAARAGEHGKGFAVVAAEVRKLAERSQKAAAEINEISNQTVKSALKSKEMLIETLPDINKTAELVQEITAASIEQNTGADQINTAIQQLSQVTQGNASSSEEMSSNSEELNSQAEELKSAVSFFRLDNRTVQTSQKSRRDKKMSRVQVSKMDFSNQGSGFDLNLDSSNSDDEFKAF